MAWANDGTATGESRAAGNNIPLLSNPVTSRRIPVEPAAQSREVDSLLDPRNAGAHSWLTIGVGSALAWVLFAGTLTARDAQSVAAPVGMPTRAQSNTAAPSKPGAQQITFVNGQLTINVEDSTLATVLARVAALTGMKLDLPAGASAERMPVVALGPGPARQVLASLLDDSGFDYIIQSSDKDPDRMENLVLMLPDKKGPGANAPEVAGRSRFGRPQPVVETAESTAHEVSISAQQESAPPDPNTAQPPAATQPDTSAPLQPMQPAPSESLRPGAMAPPTTLSPQTISQQLQQMYQQRSQMVQQQRMTGPANPGNN